MSEVRIKAEPRTEFGKGAARRVRRANKVPAVLYGHGTPPRHISLPGHELMLALKTPNVLLRIEGLPDGPDDGELALPKAVQRDVLTGFLEHVDLLVVRRGEQVEVDVPLKFVGTHEPGGILEEHLVALPVKAEATRIPAEIEVSLDGLAVGGSIYVRDIALPQGVSAAADPDEVVVHLLPAPTAAQLAESVEGAAASAEAGES
ncbi:MAG: 50S ribosomal protein L25/general stress protein Ctc [Acidothermus sp.]|nr:50S ribosomal protein L25/general stress protein Ctc [Acidothermus sp.]MCL6537545.1 50S ribosomal protein L25/general stress protein Ctc [Acidothermus sp.]